VVDHVLEALELEASVELEEEDEQITVRIEGDDLGLLIGRRGQTIDALQLLCYRAAFRGSRERKRVIVDAAGYRERREEILHRQADRAAERALQAGRPIELEPMSAQERRVVHTHLKDRPGVETYSEGEEPERSVVVAPLLAE
jgi:spoIIIJ-associated protein